MEYSQDQKMILNTNSSNCQYGHNILITTLIVSMISMIITRLKLHNNKIQFQVVCEALNSYTQCK